MKNCAPGDRRPPSGSLFNANWSIFASHSVIVPRKGVIELMRMLDGATIRCACRLAATTFAPTLATYLHLETGGWSLPGLPSRSAENPDKHLEAGCDLLKQAFARRQFSLTRNSAACVCMSAKTSENHRQQPRTGRSGRDPRRYHSGAEMEIGFNVSYVLDVLNH